MESKVFKLHTNNKTSPYLVCRFDFCFCLFHMVVVSIPILCVLVCIPDCIANCYDVVVCTGRRGWLAGGPQNFEGCHLGGTGPKLATNMFINFLICGCTDNKPSVDCLSYSYIKFHMLLVIFRFVSNDSRSTSPFCVQYQPHTIYACLVSGDLEHFARHLQDAEAICHQEREARVARGLSVLPTHMCALLFHWHFHLWRYEAQGPENRLNKSGTPIARPKFFITSKTKVVPPSRGLSSIVCANCIHHIFVALRQCARI